MAYISRYSGEEIDSGINQIPQINTNVDDLQSQINELKSSLTTTILNTIYPIGSLYTSFEATNPSTIIGGTWEQIKDTFLLAAGDTYAIGISGGTAVHTHTTAGHILTESEMPSHQHETSLFANESDIPSSYGIFGKGSILSSYNPASTYCEYFNESSNKQAEKNEYSLLTKACGNNESHSHGDTGSSSNLPPYQTIYMWKRIS